MARYSNTLRDSRTEAPIEGAWVLVQASDTGAAATLTDDNGDPLDNPFKTDRYGSVVFNTADGAYDLTYIYGGRDILIDRNVGVGAGAVLPIGFIVNALGSGTTVAPSQKVVTDSFNALYANSGSSLIGFLQAGTGAVARTVQDELRQVLRPEQFGAVGNGVADDTAALQRALNRRGDIILGGVYKFTDTLTIYGNTRLLGKAGSKLTWAGSTSPARMLQDSSLVTSTDVNLNIVLDGFELDGASMTTGGNHQNAIEFYRVGDVTISNLTVHGVGGSGIRWGMSMLDTVNVLVENNRVYDCRYGDAIQGVGRKIIVRGNTIGKPGSTTSNFGDTGIALLYDFSATTNPTGAYTTDWVFSENTIIGNYNAAGTYVGVGQMIQTGIAFGPFNVGVNTNGRVLNNTFSGCYLNVWGIVMDNVAVEGNTFGSHAATATGNTRFDGVTNLRFRNNITSLLLTGTGVDFSAVLLNAQRNVYGASVFDADVRLGDISGNFLSSVQTGVTGIRVNFENVNTSPTYVSKIRDVSFDDNVFTGFTTGVALAPQTGATNDTCQNVAIRNNRLDSVATAIVAAGGNAAQYTNTRALDNIAPGTVIPVSGSGLADILVRHKVYSKVSAPNATPTTIFAVPSNGFYRISLNVWVQAGSAAFSSVTQIVSNAGAIALRNQADGANLALSVSGLNIQASQSTGGTNDIRMTAVYE